MEKLPRPWWFHNDERLRKDAGRRSLELRTLLRRFTDVCNAIDYAHSRGVLHRDIKPGNVIVGKHGETFVVDWGLAKPLGKSEASSDGSERVLMPSSASGSEETLPGSVLGTPAYMSPEQAAGDLDRLGSRSDVYSLGATLFCLLTGKAPVNGDVFEVLRKVQKGDFSRPRQLDSSIDPALEAVCLKAMATRPEDRYPSCRALAEDVERWAADEPVTAWREPLARRAWRWVKRNRTTVTGATVALVAGLVGLSAVIVVQLQANEAIARSLAGETKANAALADANTDLSRSKIAVQARYELAAEAIKAFHTGVSEDFLLKEDKFKALRDRLLLTASDFYGKLGRLLGEETDVASRRALASSNFELGVLTWKVGRSEAALAVHRAVLAAREALLAEPGADAEAKADVGRSLSSIAWLLNESAKVDEAVATYRQAEALLAGPAGSAPASAPVRAVLAKARSHLAWLLHATGHDADALSVFRLARADGEALAVAPGAMSEARTDLADTINRIAIFMVQTGRPSESEAEFRAVLLIFQKLASENPTVTGFRKSVADSHNNLAQLLGMMGKESESEAEQRKAMLIFQQLVDNNPAVIEFRGRVASIHNNLGILFTMTGRPTAAEAEYRAGLALRRRLADENPAVSEFRSDLAQSHLSLGDLLSGTGPSWRLKNRSPQRATSCTSTRSWWTTIPLSPNTEDCWRPLTTVSATCCIGRASRRRRRLRTAVRWQLLRSWPPTIPPSPGSNGTWQRAFRGWARSSKARGRSPRQ